MVKLSNGELVEDGRRVPSLRGVSGRILSRVTDNNDGSSLEHTLEDTSGEWVPVVAQLDQSVQSSPSISNLRPAFTVAPEDILTMRMRCLWDVAAGVDSDIDFRFAFYDHTGTLIRPFHSSDQTTYPGEYIDSSLSGDIFTDFVQRGRVNPSDLSGRIVRPVLEYRTSTSVKVTSRTDHTVPYPPLEISWTIEPPNNRNLIVFLSQSLFAIPAGEFNPMTRIVQKLADRGLDVAAHWIGHGGVSIDDRAAPMVELYGPMFQDYSRVIFCIWGSFNDILSDGDDAAAVVLEQTVLALQLIADGYGGLTSTVWFTQPTALSTFPGGWGENPTEDAIRLTYNETIRTTQGARVVDVANVIFDDATVTQYMSVDGLHLDDTGGEMVADLAVPVIEPLLLRG